jgi:hypothetical protein
MNGLSEKKAWALRCFFFSFVLVVKLSLPHLQLILPSDLSFVRKLGEGTSATVYLGTYKGNEVAIKVLRDNIDPKLWEDFKKELKVMR